MEKLSGILASSPRVKAVDTERSQPARPGAPAFGRKEGRNSLGAAKAAFTLAAKEAAENQESAPLVPGSKNYKPPTEASKMKIVEDLSRRFFNPAKEDILNDNLEKVSKSEQIDIESLPEIKGDQSETPALQDY
jgi:hypothetical protein